MENLHIQIIIRCCSYDELSPADRALANAAREATNNSYAPYSHFSVGAAALLENGEVVSWGENIHGQTDIPNAVHEKEIGPPKQASRESQALLLARR